MSTPPTTELSVPYAAPGGTYAASILLPILGIVFVLLRIYARVLQKTSISLDDWLMLPALAMVIGMGITLSIGIHGKAIGYATPYDADLSPQEQFLAVNPTIQLMGMVQYAFILLMVLAFGFLKLSIVFFYRRLFVTARKTMFDRATKCAIVIVGLWTASFFFGFLFSCGTHISASWGSVKDQVVHCGAAINLDNALVVSDLLTDVMVLVLPLPVIWNLHMTIGRKLMVIGILATGAVSIIASIIKVVVSFEITNAGLNTNVDPDLTVSTILYWSMIEAGLAIIAACLPTLQFLVRKVSLDSIVNSVRSALSLQSMRSQRPESRPMGPYTNIQADSEVASTAPIVGESNTSDVLVMGNVDGLPAKENGIYVTKQVSQHNSIVQVVILYRDDKRQSDHGSPPLMQG